MKRSAVFAALTLAASLLLANSPAFAVSTTWTALGEPTQSLISNVQITKNASDYDIRMNLTREVVPANTYSVYLSPTSDVFESYTQDASATQFKTSRTSVLTLYGLTDWELRGDEWVATGTKSVSGGLSQDKKTLSWKVPQGDVVMQNFWFAGLVASTLEASNVLGKTSAVSATPIPGAIWLLGSGIFGLVGLKRRKEA